MIERYTLPAMGRIWEEEYKYRTWLAIEILHLRAMTKLGQVPEAALAEIKARADFDIQRIKEIEAVTNHDVIAFLTSVAEKVGDASKYIHMGLTSSDILDTALAVQMRDAAGLLLQRLQQLRAELVKKKAREHKYTLMMGRTHGVHAEPTTFGLKIALWVMEIDRNIIRLEQAREMISVGQDFRRVGTFANIDPQVEEYVCQRLGLKPALISTQVLQRDRHAHYLTTLAIIGASLDKMATEIRNLQRTDILEVEEPFKKGQRFFRHAP